MTKFKAGDKAVMLSVEPGWGVEVGAEVTIKDSFIGRAGPGYWVELCDKPGSCIYYAERRLGPVDDPLPPAPRCVRYNEGAAGFTFEVKSLVENAYHLNRIRLGVLCGDRDITHKYVVVDPDAALQLAHDLNRMANEIKRRERAQSGE